MQISIAILVGNANQGISYVKRLVRNFKARVLSYPNSIFEAEPCLVATLTELNDIELLRQTSLVVTPNAYNEGVLYDVVPNTPLGDMDVVRATTATRVNSSGLIEVVPRNLFQYSEAISTSPWALVRANVSTNSINSPIGTLTADTLVSNITSDSGSWTRQIVSAINGSFNMSIYAKQGTSPFLQIVLDGLGSVIFNLSNGTVKLSSSGIIGSITSVGSDGWYRCSISGTATGQTTALFIVGNSSMNLVTWFSTNGDSVYLWGAQVESGSLTEYFPTTTRLNIPRIDYTNGSCPSLLVEPQRTNLLIYSNDFISYWSNDGTTTRTANAGISPDGTQNATKIVGAGGYSYRFAPLLSAGSCTFSIYLKSTANSNLDISINDFGGAGLTTKSILVTPSWQRFDITANITLGTTVILSFAGLDAGIDYYVYGAQLEVGAYPTSYIPTVASSVTRNADVISKTGISSLIGQTEGTVFIKADNKILGQTNRTLFYVSDATANNYITVNYSAAQADTIRFFVVGNAALAALGFFVYTAPILKLAVTYKNGVYKLFINGSLIYTQTGNAFNANLESLFVGTNRNLNEPIGERIESLQLYKTELTNAECIALTTL
jgi:hypothetical protein